MKILLPIITLLLLNSCLTEHKIAKICANCPVVTEVTTVRKDSIWTKTDTVRIKEIVSVSGPTIVVPGPCDKFCDENGKLKPFFQEKRKNGIDDKIYTDTTKNILVDDCNADSLQIELDKITIQNNHLIQENKEIKNSIKVNELTGFQKFMIRSAFTFWILILIFAGYKVFKIIKKV